VIHLRRQPTEGGNSTIPTDRADTPPQTAIPSLPGSPINDCDFAFAHDGNSSWIPRDIAAALAIGNGASDESDRPNGAEQARIEDEAFINWIEACDAAPLPLEVSVEPVSAASLAANADLPSQSAAPLAANPVARQATLAMSLVLASPTLKENGATGSRRRKRSGVTWIEFAAQFLLTPRPDEPHQPTVLIAMSEDQARDQLSVALASEGYLVLTARDTHDAWEQLRASFTPIDVAVVDVDLDLSVVHLQRKIRELYPRLPVILCTSDLNHPDMTQLQGLGVAHCFVKPLALGELLATVDSLAS
jgi:CheY-like chemotaxis protein